MLSANIFFVVILFAAMFAAYKSGKLTLAGSLIGGLIAISLYLGAGLTGIALLAGFFIMAVLATSWKKKEKRLLSGSGDHPEKRDAGQVLANGGAAAICGLLSYFIADKAQLFIIMATAALASASADTLSSELGTVYGKRFYNIITFKPDEKGSDGVISLEGTLIGVAASAVISLIYAVSFGWNVNFWFIIIAGTAGNLTDSVLGATLERKNLLNNNMVNFANTVVAALVAWLLVK